MNNIFPWLFLDLLMIVVIKKASCFFSCYQHYLKLVVNEDEADRNGFVFDC